METLKVILSSWLAADVDVNGASICTTFVQEKGCLKKNRSSLLCEKARLLCKVECADTVSQWMINIDLKIAF